MRREGAAGAAGAAGGAGLGGPGGCGHPGRTRPGVCGARGVPMEGVVRSPCAEPRGSRVPGGCGSPWGRVWEGQRCPGAGAAPEVPCPGREALARQAGIRVLVRGASGVGAPGRWCLGSGSPVLAQEPGILSLGGSPWSPQGLTLLFAATGNQERGWNDPPQFSYGLQAQAGGPRRNLLTRRAPLPPEEAPPGQRWQSPRPTPLHPCPAGCCSGKPSPSAAPRL